MPKYSLKQGNIYIIQRKALKSSYKYMQFLGTCFNTCYRICPWVIQHRLKF